MRYIVFVILLDIVSGSGNDVSFIFPKGQPAAYTGYIWRGSSKVYLRPRLGAIPDDKISKSRKLCDIRLHSSGGDSAPFYTKIVDPVDGSADIFIDQNIISGFKTGLNFVFQLEAFDCDDPPHVSDKVPISIQFLAHEGPFFAQPSYTFTISQLSHVGQVVGQVQAIQQLREGEDGMYSAICDYRLSPNDVPFGIDAYGNIRVQEKLHTRLSDRPYMFQVIAEDCNRPTPRRTPVDVMIQQLAEGCQTGWKGLPLYLEIRGSSERAENLFHSFKPQLDLCGSVCANPEIETRLELKSAVSGHQLKTANSDACLHNPEYLFHQRQLCDIHPTTFVNLLPNADEDIATQLAGPSLGNPPRLRAPAHTWWFDAASKSVWQVDPKHLSGDEDINAFDADFTLAFWVRRYFKETTNADRSSQDQEETVLCSQDHYESNWRFMSVSFSDCNLVVRLMASLQYGPNAVGNEIGKPSEWTFGPLPMEYCPGSSRATTLWHHFAITFAHSPWGASSEVVSLLVDGQTLSELSVPREARYPSIPPYRPVEKKARPKITVGACFDPKTQLTKQHLNAELAGLTLLLNRPEAPNNLRCLSQCGESLLVPHVMKLLHSQVSVNLASEAITVSAPNISHVIDLIRAVAYARPQAGVSPDYAPNAAQTRLLNLTTTYRCKDRVLVSPLEIKLNVLPGKPNPEQIVEVGNPSSGSNWVPENTLSFDRPPIAQADMERKALMASMNPVESSPSLLIEGSDIVTTEPPIRSPGLPIFPDVRFTLPDGDMLNTESHVAAAAVPLDSCLVWIASSGSPVNPNSEPGLRESEGERIEWSPDHVLSLGLSVVNDKHGVKLVGNRPAGDYENLLKTLHYWPPKSIQSEGPDMGRKLDSSLHGVVSYFARIGVMCTMEAGKRTTSQFFVDVFIQSPERDSASFPGNAVERPTPVSPNHVQSHEERRRFDNKLQPVRRDVIEMPTISPPSFKPSKANQYIAIGLVTAVVLVVLTISLILAVYVRRQSRPAYSKPPKQGGRRKRFPANPADFGGSSLKHDPTLRLTANPLGQVEYSGIGTVREDLYGSSRNLAPSPHIFSPPSSRLGQYNQCPISGPKLAGLEEFDENFSLQAEQFYSEATETPQSQESAGTTSEAAPIHVYRSEADVHEWIDDDELEDESSTEQDRVPLRQLAKGDLVAERDPEEFGSTVAYL